jgi:hypothetical protein
MKSNSNKDKKTVDQIIFAIALFELAMYGIGVISPNIDKPIPIYNLSAYLIFCAFLYLLSEDESWRKFNIIRAVNYSLLAIFVRTSTYFQTISGIAANRLIVSLNIVLAALQVLALLLFVKYYKSKYKNYSPSINSSSK